MRDVVIFISEWWFAGVAFIAGWVACTALNHYLWWRERQEEAAIIEAEKAKAKAAIERVGYAKGSKILADPVAQQHLELAIFRHADAASPRPLDECIKAASDLREFRDDVQSGIRALAKQSKSI